MANNGWIKLHRSLLDWEWYDDSNAFKFFLHLLLKCNHEKKTWHGFDVNAGELIVGVEGFGKQVGLTRQQTRSAIDRLKSTNEITITTTNRFTKITVVNWEKYQSDDEKITNKITNKQPTDNQQITTTKECKNDKKEKRDTCDGFGAEGVIKLTKAEYRKLCQKIGRTNVVKVIDDTSGWKLKSKKNMKAWDNDYYGILTWLRGYNAEKYKPRWDDFNEEDFDSPEEFNKIITKYQ